MVCDMNYGDEWQLILTPAKWIIKNIYYERFPCEQLVFMQSVAIGRGCQFKVQRKFFRSYRHTIFIMKVTVSYLNIQYVITRWILMHEYMDSLVDRKVRFSRTIITCYNSR